MRLIYAENAAYLLCSNCEYFGNCIIRTNNGGCTAYKILMQDAPTIDVTDKKVGKWENNEKHKNFFRCSLYIIPTIAIVYNHPMFKKKNFSVELHFLCFHLRWMWMEQDMRGTEDEQ